MNRRQTIALLATTPAFSLTASDPAQAAARPAHVVLLGDSIFDNQRYVAAGKSVVHHFRERMPRGWEVTLNAVDGAVSSDVARQLSAIPASATHLVLSIGGNDALRNIGVLEAASESVVHGLLQIADVTAAFEERYRATLDGLASTRLPVIVCTIYNPNFPDVQMQRAAVAGLAFFNDCIIRAAISRNVPVIDLRFVCDDKADFANPIEPSSQGGEKITASIIKAIQEIDPSRQRTEFFR